MSRGWDLVRSFSGIATRDLRARNNNKDRGIKWLVEEKDTTVLPSSAYGVDLQSTTNTRELTMAKPYDQFILFGDSITELSYDPNIGFGFGAALQNGEDCIVGKMLIPVADND